MDDSQLLEEFAKTGSDDAFRTLVSRYSGLVYHTALRQVGDPHSAQEVTQAVFIALAQKAGTIRKGTLLGGWMFRATRFASINLLREQARRRRREDEATFMETVLTPDEPTSAWEQIVPQLNEALDKLPQKDRDAVLIRFFQGKSHKEVAHALGLSEDAAKMRVSRALEKLRLIFAKEGFALSSTLLLTALSTHAAQAAPANLTAALGTLAASSGAAAPTSSLTLATKTLHLMAWSKAKSAAVIASVLFLGGASITIIAQRIGTQMNAHLSDSAGAAVPNRTTPKGSLLVMAQAMESGNAQQYVETFVFNGSDELELKTNMERLVAAAGKFKEAAGKRFGEDAARAIFFNLPIGLPPHVIAPADERITGNSATVSVGKGGRAVELIKVGSAWRTTVKGFFRIEPRVLNDYVSRLIKALDETGDEIFQNKYSTIREAVDAVKQKTR